MGKEHRFHVAGEQCRLARVLKLRQMGGNKTVTGNVELLFNSVVFSNAAVKARQMFD